MFTNRPFALLSLLSATAILAACGVGQASTNDSEELRSALPVPVEVSHPERLDVYATYSITGTLASDRAADARARVAGEVISIVAEEGQRVSAGDVLARLDGERLRLQMLSAHADLEKARGEYVRYQDLHERGLVSETMYDGLKYELDALESVYELAALDYDYSVIRAPIDGVVSARNIKLGQSVAANDVAFEVTETSELVAYLQVPQSALDKFEVGDVAKLSVDALPSTPFYTRIARIGPTIDTRNGTFRATAVIDNTVGLLAPGMFARFTIEYEKHPDALTVPRQAIVVEDDESIVYVVKNDAVERRTVRTGVEYGNDVEILDGLGVNEKVVVVGQASLRDGTRVLAQSAASGRYTG